MIPLTCSLSELAEDDSRPHLAAQAGGGAEEEEARRGEEERRETCR